MNRASVKDNIVRKVPHRSFPRRGSQPPPEEFITRAATPASATLAAYPILGNPHSASPPFVFFRFSLGTRLVGIKYDRDALNVLYAHRQSHARTHASRELSGRRRREGKRQRAVEKKKHRQGGISREGQREGEKRKREREKEGRLRWSTWKLPVVVVVYGRHTGVTRTLACVRGGS